MSLLASSLKAVLHLIVMVVLTVGMATVSLPGTCASAPLPISQLDNNQLMQRTRRDAEELKALCYRKTDKELQEQLSLAASDILEEIIVVPMRIEDQVINVGAMRKAFGILNKRGCAECIDTTLDYDANRFPQYMMVTRVVETDHCQNLFIPHSGYTITVLRRENECSEEEKVETWEATTLTLPQADYYHLSNSSLSNYCN